MTNKKTIKKLKKLAIILLIAVFSLAGIISCKGADITSSVGGENTEAPDTGPIAPPTEPEEPAPEPSKPSYPQDTYYKLYIPFMTGGTGGDGYTNVSYQDTNTLNNLWKELISGGRHRNGKRFIIRDGDNRLDNPLEGNYYYFNKNYDIVHAGKYADKVRVKEFVGGVIVMYSGGNKSGTLTIGGLYNYLLHRTESIDNGVPGYTKYNNDNINEFMREIHELGKYSGNTCVTVMVMNVGFDFGTEFGVDEYYCTHENSTGGPSYQINPAAYIGNEPSNYLGVNIHKKEYWNELLNVRVNHSWNTSGKYNFKFVDVTPYDWWFQSVTIN